MKLNRVLAFLLVLALVPIPFVPASEAAYSWTRISRFEIGDTGQDPDIVPNYGNAERLTDAVIATTFESQGAGGETAQVEKCNITSCYSASALSTATGARSAKIHVIPGTTTLFGCGTSTSGVHFYRSTNSGALWEVVSVDASLSDALACDVATFDGSHYAIVWSNETTDDWILSTSTGGLAGSWVNHLALATSGILAVKHQATLAAWSDTAYTAWTVLDDDQADQCLTTDNGGSFTCNANVFAGQTVNSERFANSYYLTWTAGVGSGTDTVGFGYKSDQSSGLLQATAYNVASATTDVCSSDVAVFSATRFAVSFTICDTAGGSVDDDELGWISETFDSGATWASELVFTTDADSAGTGSHNTGIAYFSTGNIYASYQVEYPDDACGVGCAVTDGDAEAERYFYAFVTSASVAAASTATVTGLVGFDVDPTGSIAIARTESGENVQIFNAQTLGTPVGGPVDTNCAAGSNDYEDAVMSKSLISGNGNTGQLVAFLNCDVSGDAQYLSIRQTNGDIPTAQQFSDLTGETCDPGTGLSECPYDIGLTDFQEPADSGLGQLGQVKDFPIDYSNNDEVTGQDFRRVAWAWASQQCDSPPGPSHCTGTEPGDVGVSTFTMVSLDGDEANTDWVTHHPSQDVDDFCLGLDGESYYLASVVAGQPGHTWSVAFDDTGGIDDNVLDASISNNPSSFGSSGFGVACGGGQILQQNGDSDLQLLSRTGVFIDEIELTGGDDRGVSISEEFIGPAGSESQRGNTCLTALEATGGCLQFGVYVDTVATEGVVLNLTGGTIVEVGRFAMPSGTFHSIRMDRTAQNVWVATSTTIARFEVTEVTTIEPVNIPGDEDPVVPSDDGLFGGSGATIGAAFGVGAFGGNLFLGALLMGIVAYGVGTGYGNVIDSNTMQPRFLRVNPWAAAIGAAIGFLVAWGFGFFSTAAVFSLIALVAMIVGIRLWTSRGG